MPSLVAGRNPRRHSEYQNFAVALMYLRKAMRWTQQELAVRLGVSRRTLVSWENTHWLPPHKQRLHVVLTIGESSPEFALKVAQTLGLGGDPLAQPTLAALERAVEAADQPPPPERPSPEALRTAVDATVRFEADGLNVTASALRGAITRTLTTAAATGATLEDFVEALRVRKAPKS